MEVEKKRKRIRNVYYKHLTVWMYPSEWDKLNYDASGQGKTVSRYIADKVLAYEGTPPDIERDKSQKGCVKPLAFETKEYEEIMLKIEKSGQKVTQYLLNIALG